MKSRILLRSSLSQLIQWLVVVVLGVVYPSPAGADANDEAIPIFLDDQFVPEREFYPRDLRVLADDRIEFLDQETVVTLRPDGSIASEIALELEGSSNHTPWEYVTVAMSLPEGGILAGVTRQVEDFEGWPVEQPIFRKYHADGSIDESFIAWTITGYRYPNHINTGREVFGGISALRVQEDGKVLIAGTFVSVGGVERKNLARLHANGSLDHDFIPEVPRTNPREVFFGVNAFQPLTNGGLLVLAIFEHESGVRQRLVRLKPDGSSDRSFVPELGQDNRELVFAMGPNDSVYVGGDAFLVRLTDDGSRDSSFATHVDGTVSDLQVDSNGRVLIAGQFNTVNGVESHGIARLFPNGATDQSFEVGEGAEFSAYNSSLALTSSGAMILAGLSSFNGQSVNRLARVFPEPLDQQRVTFDLDSINVEVEETISRSTAEITLLRRGPIDVGLEVQLDVSGDTEIGEDHEEIIDVVQFFQGQTHLTLSVSIYDDFLYDDGEELRITARPTAKLIRLGDAFFRQPIEAGYAFPEQTATIRISDQDEHPTYLDFAFVPGARPSFGSPEHILPLPDGSALLMRSGYRPERVMANGSMDPSFLDQLDIAFVPPHWGDARQDDLRGIIGQQGAAYLFGDFHFSFRRPEDGQIVGVKNLLRLVPVGDTWAIDPEFRPPLPDAPIKDVVGLANGNILIAGKFTTLGERTAPLMARLLADGTFDQSFTPPSLDWEEIDHVAVTLDDRIVFTGDSDSGPGRKPGLRRAGFDGALDSAFYPALPAGEEQIHELKLQAPDKILVVYGDRQVRIIRYSELGFRDGTFEVKSALPSRFRSLTMEADGSMLFYGGPGYQIVRLDRDGRRMPRPLIPIGWLDAFSVDSSGDYFVYVPPDFNEFGPPALIVRKIGGFPVWGMAKLETDLSRTTVYFSQGREVTFSESSRQETLTLSRSGDLDRGSVVRWSVSDGAAVRGQDFEISGDDVLLFAPGERQKSITIDLLDDGVVEEEETFTLALAASEGTQVMPSIEVRIEDDEIPAESRPQFFLTNGDLIEVDKSEAGVSLAIRRSGDVSLPAAVRFSVERLGSASEVISLIPRSGEVTFGPNENTKSLILELQHSASPNASAWFEFTIEGSEENRNSALIRVYDDDAVTVEPPRHPERGIEWIAISEDHVYLEIYQPNQIGWSNDLVIEWSPDLVTWAALDNVALVDDGTRQWLRAKVAAGTKSLYFRGVSHPIEGGGVEGGLGGVRR